MSPTSSSSKTPRFSNRQAQKLVHGLWRENADPMYLRRDMKLRIVGASGVLGMLIGLWIGDQQGLAWVQIASVVAGVMVFGGALWRASRNYKADYKRFVVAHMADDGTFLFCPQCGTSLGDASEEHIRRSPPTSCLSCGGKPWKFERPK
ncbi:MAG: hypothetical protein AAF593_06735 [Planctomycetota bacterium]